MKTRNVLVAGLGVVVGLAGAWTAMAVVAAPEAQQEFQLPPGWTEADMQACMLAGMPGEMHERMMEDVGDWKGEVTMWMYPGAEPVTNETSSKATSLMDGRYLQVEWSGEVPGMGPYSGMGLYGFDNVSQKFVSTSIDSMGTGIAYGTGELSQDGRTLTWKYTYNCPVTRKPTVMRQIDTVTGQNTRTIDMFTIEPKSGKEYKMIHIELERQ